MCFKIFKEKNFHQELPLKIGLTTDNPIAQIPMHLEFARFAMQFCFALQNIIFYS